MNPQELVDKLTDNGAFKVLLQELQKTSRDEFIHALGTSFFAFYVGEAIGYSHKQMEELMMAGALHDIAKIRMRRDLFESPEKLTEDDWAYVKLHPRIGSQIILGYNLPQNVAKIVLEHHEHGLVRYPRDIYNNGHKVEPERRETDETIHHRGMIACACDIFDAMSRNRPYRNAVTLEVAMEKLGKNFVGDREVLDALFNLKNVGDMYEARRLQQ